MTGYGRAMTENNKCKVTVELRSYNHRFSKMTFRIPKTYVQLEDKLKKVISKSIHRGKVDLFLSVEGERLIKRKVEVDWELFESFLQLSEQMKERANLKGHPLSLESLLLDERIVIVSESEDTDDDILESIIQATKEATTQLVMMRKQEGKQLYDDLRERAYLLKDYMIKISERAPKVVDAYRERLTKRVNDFLAGQFDIDESRLLTEIALFSDKANIDEELTRLHSHIEQFLVNISTGGIVGRKLDFLVQEMNREANTIGAKANDVIISQQVVELKSEIEKIKEQVQNVE